jgi:hypothetical protein
MQGCPRNSASLEIPLPAQSQPRLLAWAELVWRLRRQALEVRIDRRVPTGDCSFGWCIPNVDYRPDVPMAAKRRGLR